MHLTIPYETALTTPYRSFHVTLRHPFKYKKIYLTSDFETIFYLYIVVL
jgi:hypothetical protein